MDLYDAYGCRINPRVDRAQQEEHPDSGRNQSDEDGNKPVDRTVGNDSAIGAKRNQPEPYEEKNYRLQERGLVVQVLLCVFTALAFAAAAYYAHVADLQLDLSRGQLGIMQRQMESANQALTNSVEQFRVDERAWIEIDHIKKTVVSVRDSKFGSAFRYSIYLKNVGKTYAHDIAVKADTDVMASIEVGGDPSAMTREQNKVLISSLRTGARENPIPRVLAPATVMVVPFVMDGRRPVTYPINDEWVSYLIGRVDYSDVFAVKHWMTFCFYIGESNGELRNCQEGNDEDRNLEVVR